MALSSIHRYRQANSVAFSPGADFPKKGQLTDVQWISIVAGPFLVCIWAYLRFRQRKLRARSSLKCEPFYNDSKVRASVGKSDSGPTQVETPSYLGHSLIRREEKGKRSLIVAMLITFGLFVWLPFHLFSPGSAVLEVFQVYQPIPSNGDGSGVCGEEALLVQHVFGFSYGHPFIGNYEPPSCEFDTVIIKLTVESQGRQFDRLAHIYLGDIEVFRTSTAEPTANGIIWTYVKDMSQYNTLWREPQKIIFELGNLVNEIYTGSFNVTVTAIFSLQGNVPTPDVILPISARKSALNSSSAFNVPSEKATTLQKIQPGISRAVVSISACGQAAEEFWWSNVFSLDRLTFNDTVGELYGYSPFREVQLYIDGILAGVVWPFPIIFTGGVAPGFWRPIVGTDAFDLRQPEIDISPFLPLLTDDQYHSFEIKIVGLDVTADGTATLSDTVNSYWLVTGTIFLYRGGNDAEPSPVAIFPHLREPQVLAPAPEFTTRREIIVNDNGHNETLRYYVRALRTLTVKTPELSWTQNVSFVNMGLFDQQGARQENNQFTYSISLFENGQSLDSTSAEYLLAVRTESEATEDELTIDAQMRRGLWVEGTGMPGVSTFTLTSGPLTLETEQHGTAFYHSSSREKNSTSAGDTTDVFRSNAGGRSYDQTVHAVNGSVVSAVNRAPPPTFGRDRIRTLECWKEICT